MNIKDILDIKDKKNLAKEIETIQLNNSESDAHLFFLQLIDEAILANQIKPIQVLMEHYEAQSAQALREFKTHIATQIVQFNQIDFIEKALLGTIIEKEEIFHLAGTHMNQEMITYFCEHDYILVYHDWIKSLYLNSYIHGTDNYIQFTKELIIEKEIELNHKNLHTILYNAFSSLNISAIEKIKEEYNYSLASLDEYQMKSLFSDICTTHHDNQFYEKEISQYISMFDYLVKNDFEPLTYLTYFIINSLDNESNFNLSAEYLWQMKEKHPTLLNQEFIDEFLADEHIAQYYHILEEKNLLEHNTTTLKENQKIKKI